jgi:deazaflavin-dependent oxidoreductase (nitroreductase family)
MEGHQMRLPGQVAAFNRVGTNRVMMPLARRAPALAVVLHVGRRTGRAFEVPVLLFSAGDRYVIPLVYGKDRDWVKNVVAVGRFSMTHRGRELDVADPSVVTHPHEIEGLNALVGSVGARLRLEGFLVGHPVRTFLVP